MAFTTPPTFVAGTEFAAADGNIYRDDIIDHEARILAQSFTGVRLGAAGPTSVSDSVWQDMDWDSATFDAGDWWTTGASITVPAGTVPAGYTSAVLSVSAITRFDANGTGVRKLRALINAGAWSYEYIDTAPAGETKTCLITDILLAVDGDVITLQQYQSSGGALDAYVQHVVIARVGLIV